MRIKMIAAFCVTLGRAILAFTVLYWGSGAVLPAHPRLQWVGQVALVREWGRLAQRGRRRFALFAGRVQAAEALETWLVRKARRGYVRRNSTASVNHPVHRDIARLERDIP